MKRLLSLVAFFATLHASAQQVNPVPDYVFRNQMSVGRGTVTDTAAYFSIGPRYGATKGFMPPIVGDTATFSSGKRNGLLIFSVQKNKFLYWDSVRVQWSDMAGSSGAYIVAGDTAAMLLPYLRKADTTAMLSPYYRSATATAALALKVNISDTATMLGNYVRHAGYGLTKSGQSFLVDTLNISTRAWRQKGDDSLGALIALRLRISDTASMLLPYLRDADTVTLSSRIDQRVKYTDTAAMLAPYAKAVAGLPIGGTTGQILAKNSATNYDAVWIDNYTTDVREYVKASVAINKGQAVYVSGADGTNVLVSKASNTTEATSSKTLGLLYQDLAQNGQGYVIIQGKLSGLNTLGSNAGDPVWLGTNGNLLYGIANKPVAPANLVYMGVVTRVNANNGEIFVHVQNGFELEELHDVLVTNKQNGQGIVYDSATALWKNRWVLTDTTTLSNRINLKVNISDTASMLTPYVRAAGYGLTKSGQTLSVDTLNIATRAWRQKGDDSLAALITARPTGTGTTNYVTKWTGSNTQGNSQIFDNGTNMGYGVTPQTWWASRKVIEINGGGAIAGTTNLFMELYGNSYLDGSLNYKYINNGSAGIYAIGNLASGGSAHTFYAAPSGTAGANATFSAALNIFSNGRTGINTTIDAGYQFDINGTLRSVNGANFATTSGDVNIGTTTSQSNTILNVNRSANDIVKLLLSNPNTGTSAYGDIEVRTGTTVSGGMRLMAMGSQYTTVQGFVQNSGVLNADVDLTGGMSIMTRANAPIRFYTNGAANERMRITEAGELLINTTSDAGDYKLQVVGNARVGTGKLDIASNTTFGLGIARSGASEVAGQIYNSNGILYTGVESSAGGQIFTGSSAYAAVIGSGANYPLQFATNNATRATINTNGELLIGSTTDAGAYALQVTGAMYTTSTITTASPTADPVRPWKLGSVQAGTVALDTANYVEVEINGTYYRLAIVTPL